MNPDLAKLKRLKDHIIGVEMHLAHIEGDLLIIARDIQFLKDLELVLQENIDVLKSDKIIAVAMEYRKAVEEIKIVRKNLSYYTTMSSRLVEETEKYNKMRNDSIFEYEILKQWVDSQRSVIPFDLSKRKK